MQIRSECSPDRLARQKTEQEARRELTTCVCGLLCRTLSLKAVRRLLEKDLGLEKKQLDIEKDLIGELIDQVCKTHVAWARHRACTLHQQQRLNSGQHTTCTLVPEPWRTVIFCVWLVMASSSAAAAG